MNNWQRIRLGLMTAKLKLDNIFTRDWEKDPNPENWRTINGSHVHLVNGKIDGGAGGKFRGNEWHGQKAHGSNSFFPRFNYQQNLFGEQEVMPSKTMQKEQNRQGRIARRAERRNQRYEAKKAAGLAKQAEYRAQLANKSPWEMNKRELKAERERLEKMDANNYWSFSHSPSSQRGYSAEAAERLAQVRAASGEKVYPWQWNKEMAKRRKIPKARHEEAIKKALEQGLPVPDDVRAEYNKAVKAKQKPSALKQQQEAVKKISDLPYGLATQYKLREKSTDPNKPYVAYSEGKRIETSTSPTEYLSKVEEFLEKRKNHQGEVQATSEDPNMNKLHPFWKTPEGKAQSYFDNMMLASRRWTQPDNEKMELMAQLAAKKVRTLNSAAAGINQKIARLNQKRTLTREDEKEKGKLLKQRREAEHEANAFAAEWEKWKKENNIQTTTKKESKQLENGLIQTSYKTVYSYQPQKSSALEAIAARQTAKAPEQKTFALKRIAARQKEKAAKPAKTAKKKPVKQQLTDIIKEEAGFDIAGHERAGKEKARGEIHLKWSDLDEKQQTAIKNIEKDGLGTVDSNGGYGVVIRPMWQDKPTEDSVTIKENDLFTLTTERQPFKHGESAPRFYLFRFKKQPSEDVANILSGYGYKPTVNNIWVSPADHYASKRARESVRAIETGYEPIPF